MGRRYWRRKRVTVNDIEMAEASTNKKKVLKPTKPKPRNEFNGVSIGERRIAELLKEWGIGFEREMTFYGCVNPKTKKELRFDFYIPSYNLLLEYDGRQHYKLVGNQKAEELFSQMDRDKIKNLWCENNGIRLVRIPSKEYSRLEWVLKDILELT